MITEKVQNPQSGQAGCRPQRTGLPSSRLKAACCRTRKQWWGRDRLLEKLSLLREVSPAYSMPSIDWMRPTPIMECNLLYSESINVNVSHARTSSWTHPGREFNSISGHPTAQ